VELIQEHAVYLDQFNKQIMSSLPHAVVTDVSDVILQVNAPPPCLIMRAPCYQKLSARWCRCPVAVAQTEQNPVREPAYRRHRGQRHSAIR